MAALYFYRIPKIDNFGEEAAPAIAYGLDRKNPAKLVEFIKHNNIQMLTPSIKFSEAELSGIYDRTHPLIMTFMLAVLERPDEDPDISTVWLHELVMQTEERQMTYLTNEQQDKLYELLLQIHEMWGNLSKADTEPFNFPGYLSKIDVVDLLNLLKSIEFQEDAYKEGAKELMEYLQMAKDQNREIVMECQM